MKYGQLDTAKIVVTDWECYYDNDYHLLRNGKGLRTEEFILDKRWKAYGFATANAKGKTDWIPEKDTKKWLKANRGLTMVNHKMTFDGLIWKLRYNHVAPFLVDTLFLANMAFGPAEVSGGNSLEDVAVRLGLQPKGKIEDIAKGKFVLTDEEEKALIAYATNDADLAYNIFQRTLPLLSRPEFELWLLDHTLKIYIDKPLNVNVKLAEQTIDKVRARVEKHLKELPPVHFEFTTYKTRQKKGVKYKEPTVNKMTVNESVLSSNPQFSAALLTALKRAKMKVPMKAGANGEIPALAKADEGFTALLSAKDKTVRALVKARMVKKSGDTQIARLRGLLLCASTGGFRVYLNYCGGHTGRWSGGSGLNAHNFPNPMKSPDEFEREVAGLIRACVVPDKGKVFVAVDAANIEARVLAAWAEQWDLVEAFGKGIDVYSTFAAEKFGEEVRKPKADDPPARALRFKLLRGVGKATILGLGFSMGNTPAPGKQYGKFESNLRSNPEVRELFISGELNTAICNDIIKEYRTKYHKIPELWNKVETAFLAARNGAQRMVNGVLFSKGPKRGVDVTLPSGRVLRYPDVRMADYGGGGRQGGKQWCYGHGKGKKLYGGLLVENIVQAMARDILAEGVWAMEEAGYPVAYHVHDSIVSHVKKSEAKKALAYCIESLSTPPAWAEKMQLGAEGTIEEVFA